MKNHHFYAKFGTHSGLKNTPGSSGKFTSKERAESNNGGPYKRRPENLPASATTASATSIPPSSSSTSMSSTFEVGGLQQEQLMKSEDGASNVREN
jgi:hypothetical protein